MISSVISTMIIVDTVLILLTDTVSISVLCDVEASFNFNKAEITDKRVLPGSGEL